VRSTKSTDAQSIGNEREKEASMNIETINPHAKSQSAMITKALGWSDQKEETDGTGESVSQVRANHMRNAHHTPTPIPTPTPCGHKGFDAGEL
jgi:hypothetical protein